MSSTQCEYNQEGFCTIEEVEGQAWPCPCRDDKRHCNAKPEDLVETCEFCGQPWDECECEGGP